MISLRKRKSQFSHLESGGHFIDRTFHGKTFDRRTFHRQIRFSMDRGDFLFMKFSFFRFFIDKEKCKHSAPHIH